MIEDLVEQIETPTEYEKLHNTTNRTA